MSTFLLNRLRIAGCRTWVVWVVALAIAMISHRAYACTIAKREVEFFEIDSTLQAVDITPPAPLMNFSASVYRITDSVCYADGKCMTTSCGPSASVVLDYDQEATPEDEQQGVRVRLIEGSVPEAMGKLMGAALPLHERVMFDMEYQDVASVNAKVALTVVDRAGNESPESEPITLTWSGCTVTLWGVTSGEGCLDEERFDCSDDGGCVEMAACSVRAPGRSAGDGNTVIITWLLFAALTWYVRRYRRGYCGKG